MTFFSKNAAALAVCSVLAAATAVPSDAALTPTLKCQTGKLKAVGSFASCLFKAEAKGAADMLSPDFTKCREKINSKFPKLETSAGLGVCPSEMDLVDIRDRTEAFEGQVADLLAGITTTTTTTTLPAGACGDGNVDAGEECDVANLDGETCATQGFFNGDLACGPACQFDTAACNATRYVDTGTTILDHQTGLEWEKKTNADGVANTANAHDVDNTYTWAAAGTPPSGTLFTDYAGGLDFLRKLNGAVDHPTKVTLACFENHCDWRVPTVDELQTILLNPGCGSAPCVLNAIFVPNRSGRYWTASTRVGGETGAYVVDFTNPPLVGSFAKTTAYHARAVRRFRD